MKLSNVFFGGLLVAAIASAPVRLGCGSKPPSCDAVVEHVRELEPARNAHVALSRCEAASNAERACILDASSRRELYACEARDRAR